MKRAGYSTGQGCCCTNYWHVRLSLEVRLVQQGLKQHVHKWLGSFLEKDIKLIHADLFELLLALVLFHECHDVLRKRHRVSITHVF